MDALLRIPDDRRHVLILVNPKAGAWSTKRSIERLVERLASLGMVAEVIESPDQLQQSAEQRHGCGELRAVVSAGGDGTASLVFTLTPPNVPVAILPQGTENLLARFLRLPRRPESIAELVAGGRLVQLDGGEANGRLFTLMASCGFDAEIVRRLSEARRGNISHLSYFKPFLEAVRSYQYPTIRIRSLAEGSTAEVEGKWAVVTNTPLYALGIRFAPEALPHDGLLDLTCFRNGGWFSMARYYSALLAGWHPRRFQAASATGASFILEADGPVPYQLDGDPGGVLPLEVKVLPGRLTLVVSKAVQGDLCPQENPAAEYSH